MNKVQSAEIKGSRWHRYWPSLAGGAVWLAAIAILRPQPMDERWARAILALGALVVVPLALSLVGQVSQLASCSSSAGPHTSLKHCFVGAGQLVAGLLFGAAQLLPSGIYAAALALPWLLVTGLVALTGLRLAWQFRRGPIAGVVAAAGMIFLAVGGGWAIMDRAGIRPLDFDPAIVLLTAIHFHYAGFALPILTGLAGPACRANPEDPSDCANGLWSMSRWQRHTDCAYYLIGSGVIASVPLVAVGITTTQLGFSPWMEVVAAWCMSLSGLGVAWLYLRLAFRPETTGFARELWAFGGLLFSCGMILSIVYGSRSLFPWPWLDIPWMRALHGTANALGFALPCLIGWCLRPGPQWPRDDVTGRIKR